MISEAVGARLPVVSVAPADTALEAREAEYRALPRRRGLVPLAPSVAADARHLPRRAGGDHAAHQQPAGRAGGGREPAAARAVRAPMKHHEAPGQTLRSIAALREAGLAPAADPAALARGGRALCGGRHARDGAADRSRRRGRPDRAPVRARRARAAAAAARSAPTRSATSASRPCRGVVHRYPDRVLLKLTHVCPVYCRFCFRREVVGPGGPQALSGKALDAALAYIAATPAIWEVILTGGDPFMLSPRRIAEVTRRLGAIPHVKVLRWHTRVPVVDPGRVTAELVAALRSTDKTVYVALHANHAARADRRRARRLRPPRRCRHPPAQPDRAAEGRQRRCRDAGSPHARVRGSAREALLPAPPRCGARHQPLPHLDRRGPGA